MTSANIRRAVAAVVAASCVAIPVSASAQTLSPTFRSDAAQADRDDNTTTSAAKSSTLRAAQTLPPTFRSDAAQSGGTQPEPTTVEVVQPERTIVRDDYEVLPIVLSGTALLAVLALFGFTLMRTRLMPRPGRSH